MNKLKTVFNRCSEEGRKAIIAHAYTGYPDIKTSMDIVKCYVDNGVDAIEVGVPFSDPIAGGKISQQASTQAIKLGATFKTTVAFVAEVHNKYPELPIIVSSYFNIFHYYGVGQSIKELKQAGANGIVIFDLPYEESEEIKGYCKKESIDYISYVSSATSFERGKMILAEETSIAYSTITNGLNLDIADKLTKISQSCSVPIAIEYDELRDINELSLMGEGAVILRNSLLEPIVLENSSNPIDEIANIIKNVNSHNISRMFV